MQDQEEEKIVQGSLENEVEIRSLIKYLNIFPKLFNSQEGLLMCFVCQYGSSKKF